MTSQSGYWKFDPRRNDRYHGDWDERTQKWVYTWEKDTVPGPPVQPPRPSGPGPPHPIEPYGAQRPPQRGSSVTGQTQPREPYGARETSQPQVSVAGQPRETYAAHGSLQPQPPIPGQPQPREPYGARATTQGTAAQYYGQPSRRYDSQSTTLPSQAPVVAPVVDNGRDAGQLGAGFNISHGGGQRVSYSVRSQSQTAVPGLGSQPREAGGSTSYPIRSASLARPQQQPYPRAEEIPSSGVPPQRRSSTSQNNPPLQPITARRGSEVSGPGYASTGYSTYRVAEKRPALGHGPETSKSYNEHAVSDNEDDGWNDDTKTATRESRLYHEQQAKAGTSSKAAMKPSVELASATPSTFKKTEEDGRNPSATPLDPKLFMQIKPRPDRFFVVGKVFILLYIENAGDPAEGRSFAGPNFTLVPHGQYAFHQFRRFVVVKEVNPQRFCYCCPISTYRGQATTKKGVEQSAHAIVYTGDEIPSKLPGETDMNKDPMRIIPKQPSEKMDPHSRINFGRVHSIDHKWKVREIGNIDRRLLPKLLGYRREEVDRQSR